MKTDCISKGHRLHKSAFNLKAKLYVILLFSCCCVTKVEAQATIASSDSLALIALYNSTDGQNWIDNTNSNNVVEFNGALATVTTSTPTNITTVLPADATTGPLSVATGDVRITSAENFTVTGNSSSQQKLVQMSRIRNGNVFKSSQYANGAHINGNYLYTLNGGFDGSFKGIRIHTQYL